MQKLILTTSLCLISLLASGCAKVGLFVANVPYAFNNAQLHEDIFYDSTQNQTLDVYAPQNANNAPVIIFFYGGRWTDGKKEQYRFVADTFTKHGYVVVIPDYRKYPNVKFPAFVEDGAAAVAWSYNNIENYGGDQDNIFILGHSSGAHIASLVATDKAYLESYDLKRDILKGFVGLSGPYAFIPEDEDLKDMFGPPERYPLMRAPNYVDGQQPPMLLIHGLDDEIVVLENAEKLRDAIIKNGGEVELKTYEGIDHIETVGALMWFWRYKAGIENDIVTFTKKYKAGNE